MRHPDPVQETSPRTVRSDQAVSAEQAAHRPRPLVSVAIALGVAVAIWRGVDAVVEATLPGYSLAAHAARALGCGVLTLLAVVAYLRWTGQTWDVLGWHGRRAPRELVVGMLAYLLPAGLAIAALVGFGSASIHLTADPAQFVGQLLLLVALVALFEAIPEELLVRGWVFGALAQGRPTWAAIVGQAVLFCLWGVLIGAAPSVDRLIAFGLFALVQGWLRAQTGSVACTIGFHLAFQVVAQGLLAPTWDAVTLLDPGEWVALLGVGLVPFVVAPFLARALLRRG